jgi:hypothetical protein
MSANDPKRTLLSANGPPDPEPVSLSLLVRRTGPRRLDRCYSVEFTPLQHEEGPMATQDSPSLYERLGGVYSIATVIDDFIDRIMVDPRLNAEP